RRPTPCACQRGAPRGTPQPPESRGPGDGAAWRALSYLTGTPRAKFAEQLADLERPVGTAFLGLVVIAMALHAARAGAHAGLVTLATGGDRGHQDVLGLGARRGLVALGTADRPVGAVVESRVRQPARRDRR